MNIYSKLDIVYCANNLDIILKPYIRKKYYYTIEIFNKRNKRKLLYTYCINK